ncbi:hypothetical protein [Arthrobacter sp. CAN_C5]|uniref:hypothetical protein n=1 Tax=Arthrobacter sp. CAN_C5 TaxID=2760706 RepID=UPI001AE93783|nr:hypothetical protein [Arthrobacter sp. CAN_C5]MBP2215978.1 hypothetical protein [Arthrobacter sp. CAN_C5]
MISDWGSLGTNDDTANSEQKPRRSRTGAIRKWFAQFHWGWVLGLVLTGFLITLLAFFPRYLVGVRGFQGWPPWLWLDQNDLPVVQSVITNVGTAFITAGLLALFEPLLTRKVREEAKAAALVEAAPLAERLDTLEDRVGAAVAEEVKRQDETLHAAEQNFAYDSVFRLLTQAVEVGALAGEEIFIQATDNPGEVTLSIALKHIDNVFDRETVGTSHVLVLRAESTLTDSDEILESTWSPSEEFTDVARHLVLALSKAGAGILNIPWGRVATRFTRALSLAVRSRRRDSDEIRLKGRLREVVADIWFITDQGLQCPTHNFQIEAAKWPPIRMDGGLGGLLRTKAVAKPSTADQAEWDYVFARCDALFAERLDAAGNKF